MRKFLIRYYWYNGTNLDDVLITRQTVEATTVHEAYTKNDPRTVIQPEGYYTLNWVVSETV